MKVFGVVGRNGSGKDEVVDYLKEKYGIPKLSIGDIVREIAQTKGLAASRETLQKIADSYRSRLGRDYFAREAVRRIQARKWDAVGVTGIRTPADVSVFKETYGSDLLLIRVRVDDPKRRFERIRKRNSPRDPDSYAAFRRQDQREEALFHLSRTFARADVTLSNDGSLAAFHRQIDRSLAGLLP